MRERCDNAFAGQLGGTLQFAGHGCLHAHVHAPKMQTTKLHATTVVHSVRSASPSSPHHLHKLTSFTTAFDSRIVSWPVMPRSTLPSATYAAISAAGRNTRVTGIRVHWATSCRSGLSNSNPAPVDWECVIEECHMRNLEKRTPHVITCK